MGRQDLGYQITVNDAQLRLATQHIVAFNAELEASTLTGRKVDQQLRSVGRRAAQTGNFFLRNLTIPLGLAGAASIKMGVDFENALNKVSALVGASRQEVERFRKTALSLSEKHITEGPTALANAMFFLKSVGFSTNMVIGAMPGIAAAAAAGLGSTAEVADVVASALDAYGFSAIRANQATAVLIETVTKGKVAPDSLAKAIGRVIPIANALDVSFDQVGASIANLTRQGLSADQAVTGVRAIFQTILRAQPQTKAALKSIGSNVGAVQDSLKKFGVFPTLIALRKEFGGLNIDMKTLKATVEGNDLAMAKLRARVGTGNNALAKLFPNVRALAAFLIIASKNTDTLRRNASIFRDLQKSFRDPEATLRRARSVEDTPVGRLRLAISDLRAEATQFGDSLIPFATRLAHGTIEAIHFVKAIGSAIDHLGPLKGVLKSAGIGLLLFGPVVALFGRTTQAVSGVITGLGKLQERAVQTAFSLRGVSIAEDKALIDARKATVLLDENLVSIQGNAAKTAAALRAIAPAAGFGMAPVTKVNAGTSNLRPSRVSSPTSSPSVAAGAAAVAVRPFGKVGEDQALLRVAELRTRAQKRLAVADAEVAGAQERLNVALRSGISQEIAYARAALGAASASQAQAATAARAVFQNERTLGLVSQITAAEAKLAAAEAEVGAARVRSTKFIISEERAGVTAAQRQVVAIQEVIAQLERQLALEQRIIAGRELSAGQNAQLAAANAASVGSFSRLGQVTQQQANLTAAGTAGAARIMATKWGAAVEGMKSTAKFGFDFIAFIFAADLAQKIIFDSDRTKKAVTKDLLDIHKAGLGAGIGLAAAVVGIANIGSTAGGLRALTTEMGALSLATLGWRAKLGLAAGSVLALQGAGVHLETIFNAAMVGMLARTVALRLGIVATGAAFGPWGIAAAAAATVIISQTSRTKEIVGELKKELIDISEFVQHGHGKRNLVSFLFGDPGKRGLLGNKLFPPSEQEKLRMALGRTSKDAGDKEQAAIELAKRRLKEFQKTEIGLGSKVRSAADDLFSRGHVNAAIQLVDDAQLRKQKADVQAAIRLLKSEGKNDTAAILEGVVESTKRAASALKGIFSRIEDNVLVAFDGHTDRMLETFDRQTSSMLDGFDRETSKILEAFDRKTSDLEEKLKIKVTVPKLNETFTIKVDGKTPAERELDALDKIQNRRNFKRDLVDANEELALAREIGDPLQIRAAQRKIDDARLEERKFGLDKRAKTERTAADLATKTQKRAFEDQRKALRQHTEDQRSSARQSIQDGRDVQRRNLDAMRTVQRDTLKAALDTQEKLFSEGKIGVSKFYTNILAIMAKNKVSLGQAGHDAGQAFAGALGAALDALKVKAEKDLAAVTKAAKGATRSLSSAIHQFKDLDAFLKELTPSGQPKALAPVAPAPPSNLPQPKHPANALLQALGGKLINRGGGPEITGGEREKLVKALSAIGIGVKVPEHETLPKLKSLATFLSSQGALDDVIVFLKTGKIPAPVKARGFKKGGVVPGPNQHLFSLPGKNPGLRRHGNIDLLHRPTVKNKDGTVSTVASTSFGIDAGEVLIPTVVPLGRGRVAVVSPDAAFDYFKRSGRHLGIFDNAPHANGYAQRLHQQQANVERLWVGGIAPGSGSEDTVQALLTPGEVVLNQSQQQNLLRRLGLSGGPQTLFREAQRFATGGVAKLARFASGGIVDDVRKFDWLKELERMLARNSGARAKAHREGREGPRPTHIESLVNNSLAGSILPKGARLEAMGKLAQEQAHPVRFGLLPGGAPSGVRPDDRGGVRGIASSAGATSVSPNDRGGAIGATFTGAITIKIDGADQNPQEIALAVRHELSALGARNANVRRGSHAGRRPR